MILLLIALFILIFLTEYRYKFQQLLNVFGNQIEPPDVPRKYILDALKEIRVYGTDEGFSESMQRWITRLEGWQNEMSKIRMARKLNKGIIVNRSRL